jgi:hypothetical protein
MQPARSPDIFQQERNDLIEAQTSVARSANALRLRPGDCVDITGLQSREELTLGTGETKRVVRLFVSTIQVCKRAERISLTVYERKRGN